jgi:hypothetical protein
MDMKRVIELLLVFEEMNDANHEIYVGQDGFLSCKDGREERRIRCPS